MCLFWMHGLGAYSTSIKKAEKEIKDMAKKINDFCCIKEPETGLAAPSQWDLVSVKQMMQEKQPLLFIVGLGDKVSPTDIEEGMRVGVDKNKYQIQISFQKWTTEPLGS